MGGGGGGVWPDPPSSCGPLWSSPILLRRRAWGGTPRPTAVSRTSLASAPHRLVPPPPPAWPNPTSLPTRPFPWDGVPTEPPDCPCFSVSGPHREAGGRGGGGGQTHSTSKSGSAAGFSNRRCSVPLESSLPNISAMYIGRPGGGGGTRPQYLIVCLWRGAVEGAKQDMAPKNARKTTPTGALMRALRGGGGGGFGGVLQVEAFCRWYRWCGGRTARPPP